MILNQIAQGPCEDQYSINLTFKFIQYSDFMRKNLICLQSNGSNRRYYHTQYIHVLTQKKTSILNVESNVQYIDKLPFATVFTSIGMIIQLLLRIPCVLSSILAPKCRRLCSGHLPWACVGNS